MIELKPYNYENRLGRCTSRDEYGNADVKGVDMSFMLGLPYEEMAILAQALNRLADFEDAEIAEDKKLREKSNKKMNDDLISRQAAIALAYFHGKTATWNNLMLDGIDAGVNAVDVADLKKLPAVQIEPKTGRWIFEEGDGRKV